MYHNTRVTEKNISKNAKPPERADGPSGWFLFMTYGLWFIQATPRQDYYCPITTISS
jgi:hypothetical protein